VELLLPVLVRIAVVRLKLPDRFGDDRVTLRPLRLTDAEAYAAGFRDDPQMGRLLGLEEDPDESAARSLIEAQTAARDHEDRTFFRVAIADPVTDALWGELIVHSLSAKHRRAEVGFWLAPGVRGHGVGSHAVSVLISWMFEALDLLRVEMTTTPDNPVVPALGRRLGFSQEGVLRARNFERGQRVDLVWFGLLREEWPAV
jgi:ribosomal-protein-alanine N-acetyltransferase